MSRKTVAWKHGYFSMSEELKVKVKKITVMLRQNSRVGD